MSFADVVTMLTPSKSPCERLGLGQERRSNRMVGLEVALNSSSTLDVLSRATHLFSLT